MQPCDVLTIRAILDEARPLIVNRKVEKVQQSGRDEIMLALRSRSGVNYFLVSAHASYGRLCLVNGGSRNAAASTPGFCAQMRKQLTAATLVGVEQVSGERIVDLVFSCLNEVGSPALKILTVEIMGRHSNLIFWEKEGEKIIAASHVVTSQMSRQREVASGLRYVRPNRQARLNIFKLDEEEFGRQYQAIDQNTPAAQWLTATFSGLGRYLAEEIAFASKVGTVEPGDQLACQALFERIKNLQEAREYHPLMRLDLSRYTVKSWLPEGEDSSLWKAFPSVNDLIEEYYHKLETKERFQQLKERLSGQVRSQAGKLSEKLSIAVEHMGSKEKLEEYKKFGDLILAHIGDISAGQAELVCDDYYAVPGTKTSIALNPNQTPAQNAQAYYRQFAKLRARQQAATTAKSEAEGRLETLRSYLASIEKAETSDELQPLQEVVLGHKEVGKQKLPPKKKNEKQKLLNITSSDGWTIYLGRNRQENDLLINKLAQPQDIWMHVSGLGGAHVLIRVPSTKQEPPATTLKEAAQLAARLSKAGGGGKVRVVYTLCRHVRKLGKNRPGLVSYENEKTIEVDTSSPMPPALKTLFASKHGGHK